MKTIAAVAKVAAPDYLRWNVSPPLKTLHKRLAGTPLHCRAEDPAEELAIRPPRLDEAKASMIRPCSSRTIPPRPATPVSGWNEPSMLSLKVAGGGGAQVAGE
ncbi:hypothetical protein MRB53_003141 [Persea americana]|uniref:Uncharacterized protein n=1 Tax=Persea americana TaxID=3435 RepID=A0ACC2MX73_PERAE|nr:hypothetical protein MRB53_003141 [Persea americana]